MGFRSAKTCGALLAITLVGAMAIPAWAQPGGEVHGVVRGTDGRPLPQARVTVVGLGRAARVDAEGRFVLRALPAGRHRLEASVLGHAPATREVQLTAGARAEVEIVLTPTPLSLPELQVTGSVGASDPLAVARATSQLGGRALERSLGATLAQTLDRQPGISVRYNGPAASAPVMRGLTGDRVLVLQDGQRTGDLAGSAPDHAVTVDPLVARRIEVVRGPASLLYGNNALGGVVNVISDDIPTAVPARAEWMLAGQAESAIPGAGGSGRVNVGLGSRWALTARGGARSTGDVRIARDPVLGTRLENTGLDTRNAAVGLGYVSEGVAGGISARAFDFAYGLPMPAGADGIRLDGRRWEGAAKLEASLPSPVFPSVKVDAGVQDYRHDEMDAAGVVGSTFALRTRTAGATLRQGALGPFRDGAWGATALARQYTSEGAAALTPPVDARSWGVFAFQEARIGGTGASLQLGARFDRYEVESQETAKFGPARHRAFHAVSGSAGISVPLADGISAGLSAARAFRAPTVEELFSGNAHAGTGAVEFGNPALDAEVSQGLDAVLRVRRPRLSAEAAAYAMRVADYVYPTLRSNVFPGMTDTMTVDGGLLPVFAYTQDDALLRGAEAMVEWVAAPRWVLGMSGDVVRAEREGGTPLPFLPPARLGASLRWDDGRLSLGGEVRHAFAQRRVSEEDGTPTGAYTLFDLTAGVQITRGAAVHSVTLQAENATNVLYRDATSRIKDFAPNPGRNLSVVYRVFF